MAGCVPQPFGAGCCGRWSRSPPCAGGTGEHRSGDRFLPWCCGLSMPLSQLSSSSLENGRGSWCQAWGHPPDCVLPAVAQGVATEYGSLLIAGLSCSSWPWHMPCPSRLPASRGRLQGSGSRPLMTPCHGGVAPTPQLHSPKPKHNPGVGNQFPVPGRHKWQPQALAVEKPLYPAITPGAGNGDPQSPRGGGATCANKVPSLQGLAGLVPPPAHPPPGPAPHLHLRAFPHPPLPGLAHQIRLPEFL